MEGFKRCKAFDKGLCEGDGWVKKSTQRIYCSDDCRKKTVDEISSSRVEKNKITSVTTPTGCTLKPSTGRCKMSISCKHYSDCLRLAWVFNSEGFTSDCKGFEQKIIMKSDGWNDTGDYTLDYIDHS